MFFTVYRTSTTGSFGYVAYDGTRELFHIGSSVMWDPEVTISCENGRYNFRSTYDRETTLIPGITARNIHNASGSLAAVLRFEEDWKYSFLCPGKAYRMEEIRGEYLAFDGNRCVFSMKRAERRGIVPAVVSSEYIGQDVEAYFEVSAEEDLPLPTVALFTAFPLLRFDR